MQYYTYKYGFTLTSRLYCICFEIELRRAKRSRIRVNTLEPGASSQSNKDDASSWYVIFALEKTFSFNVRLSNTTSCCSINFCILKEGN